MAGRDSSLILNAWNEDPTKMAVLRAMVACQVRLHHNYYLGWEIGAALAQQYVCSYLSIFIGREESALLNSFQVNSHLRTTLWSLSSRPVGNGAEENQ